MVARLTPDQKVACSIHVSLDPWRNGSASDSRSEGCVFDSRRVQTFEGILIFHFVSTGGSWLPTNHVGHEVFVRLQGSRL
ncbi:hypothetical protein CR513_61387, partial [Mucuna pruriens]